jgi:hypothetical protein
MGSFRANSPRALSIVVVVMTIASVAAVVIAVLVPLALLPALSLHFTFALMILIVTLIFRIVFPRSHEVHRPITGVVFMAVLAPIFCMIRRDVQIDGRRRCALRLDQHGLCIDDRRRTLVADIDLTIYARDDLTGQHDTDVDAPCVTCGAGAQER